MYNIILLRHGRSIADDENKCEGRYDSPLTEVGEKQAVDTAKKFIDKKIEFNVIMTSPLIRAYKTAEIINKTYQVPIVIEPLLMEHDNGIIAGMDKTFLDTKYPLPSFLSPFKYYPEHSGENSIMVHSRAGMALNKIIDYGPNRILVVSHGGILNAIIRNIMGINPMINGSGVSFNLKDNGYVIFKYNELKHHWKMKELG